MPPVEYLQFVRENHGIAEFRFSLQYICLGIKFNRTPDKIIGTYTPPAGSSPYISTKTSSIVDTVTGKKKKKK